MNQTMSWRRIITAAVASLILVCSIVVLSCRTATAPAPAPITVPLAQGVTATPTVRVTVSFVITGIAHLVDMGGGKRLLLVPNFINAGHQPLLLATDDYQPTGLDQGPRVQMLTSTAAGPTFRFRVLPPGFEIDPAALPGWNTQENATLVFTEQGDAAMGEMPAACPNSAVPASSLHWLPDLPKLSNATAVKLKEAQIMPNPAPADVVMRMDLKGGRLAAALAPDLSMFLFRNGKPGVPDPMQAVAEYLVYSFVVDLPADDPVFALTARPFGTNDSVTLATFRPDPSGEIQIVLANVPPEGFFNPQLNMTIEHLSHYYEIYDPNGTTINTATAERTTNCSSGIGGGVECGPDRTRT